MKILVCYYSGSGNTKLACEYIKSRLKPFEVELFDIVRERNIQPDQYDMIGFATFTDLLAAPQKLMDFIDSLDVQNGKPAFVFNTYGFISGHTALHMKQLVSAKGFDVLAGFSLHMPENFPPMIRRGHGFENAPSPKELRQFDAFLDRLEASISSLDTDQRVTHNIRIPFIFRIIPVFSRKRTKKDFGIQQVSADLCRGCGVCQKGCPYAAIEMNPQPVFDHDKCHGCWYCYNICPSKAVTTAQFKGEHQYPRPSKKLKEKMRYAPLGTPQ